MPADFTNGTVTFNQVSKVYKMGEVEVPALKRITLTIPPKRFSMILGPSGSGKSTLLNLIGCLDKASGGQITVCGQDIAKLSDDEISEFRAQNIGYVFQSYNLIPVLSAFENIEYPLFLLGLSPSKRKAKVDQMLGAVGLTPFASHRPNQLSGGQKQRVAIARALVKGPNLVLADEPTANLDSKTGASIIDLMYKIQEEFGATFVFSTHDPQLISHAQDAFFIKDGEIAEHRVDGKKVSP